MQSSSRNHIGISVSSIILGVVIGGGGLTALQGLSSKINVSEVREVFRQGTVLTSPLLECKEMPESVSDETLSALHHDVESVINVSKKSGDIIYASVYFRDLNNGPWFGINESDEFFPASLLKLPLAMSFYDRAEDDPGVLTREIVYEPDSSLNTQTQPFSPDSNVQAGQKYTVKDLIDIMLQESSNESAMALANIAGHEQIVGVYHDLGLKEPVFGQDYKIDTHKYASFFRVLYNATYIDRNKSERILDSLTKASFKDGLVAGIPASVRVAHKFGSRQLNESASLVQLHDCGIVYAPGRPYILCVMTQGKDFTKLADLIRTVSKVSYDHITTQVK